VTPTFIQTGSMLSYHLKSSTFIYKVFNKITAGVVMGYFAYYHTGCL